MSKLKTNGINEIGNNTKELNTVVMDENEVNITEQSQEKPLREIDTSVLSKLNYVKVAYTALDGNLCEVTTEVKFIGDVLISLFYRSNEGLYIDCPQEVMLKFITPEAMYMSNAKLYEIKKTDKYVYFSIVPPKKMVKQQNRKFSRVELNRCCVLVINDNNGVETTYFAKTVNMSASGILIKELENVFSKEYVAIEPSRYDCYHIMVYFERDVAVKLFARYVRHDIKDGSHRYAFHFLNMKPDIIEFIDRYVAEEQLKQLKAL